ncbi:MAG TPA: hypothetical protein VEN81_08365 [Planctomycetota bacterium]|nr:hypothetical protein [Planctomycetota bacterium]
MQVLLAVLLAAGDPEDDLATLARNRAQVRILRGEAAGLRTSAHEWLDRGEYGKAADGHRQSLERDRLARELEAGEVPLRESILVGLLPRLDDDAVEVREKAERQLFRLGPAALGLLERSIPGRSAEAGYRIRNILGRLGRLEFGADGRLHQWALTARASSEYSPTDWSAMQATGKPDTHAAGDARTAWASMEADGGLEWLELGYENAVVPTSVRIHETFNPGAVVKIEGQDLGGDWRVLWEGKDPLHEAIGWLEVAVPAGTAIRSIRVILDTASVPGWNEIDAVELVGELAP